MKAAILEKQGEPIEICDDVDIIDPNREDLSILCQDLTGGFGLDYAFETAGSAELISQCVGLIRAGGSTVCVGSPPTSKTSP